ncbi:nickel pincer cofactor biosynthesis protein LarC [Oceanirhabdus seepicola]|uniref:Pyridinium-3,5-bisthiocarboxylic acid mononucleotide nickel insertion protein n=1 Tax=Oceanirhabdus seepicola TaxID=2828781 RepID=A0A9J6NZP9_9CLOT|nr:nickel pincer cofactor biosynthesis protein LarC [Oceanirhabdus seepicola]MCM1990023.1 nickel pincer cofactor biosynthesis protein LarC [Oceanirhabdus seepicola]
MKILYYDCFSGVSGDMNLGALVDIGVPKELLLSEIKKLNIDGISIEFSKKDKLGIYGTKVDVIYEEGHVHRNINDIREILDKSELSETIKKRAMKMFILIGEAEGKVHNKSLEEIHFHEVGAIDSIVDVVGAAICLEYLDIDEIWCSTVQLGGGFVKCAHGTIPVPAPAVCEILKDVPVKSGLVQFETSTPTGAAIIKGNVDKFTDTPDFKIVKTGYGVGTRDMDIPNVLRVYIGEASKGENKEKFIMNRELMIECNIDDMKAERFEFIMEKIFEIGAKDVFMENIIMKKSRPGVKLGVLCDENISEDVIKFIFKNTTSLGIRKYFVDKVMMKRKFQEIMTPWGAVTVKGALIGDEVIKFKGEYDDIKKIVQEHGISFNEVEEYIIKNI